MRKMTCASVCSGIEAASVAWQPLGWRFAWLAETDPFASAVLNHHHPGTPNLGDMNAITETDLGQHGPIDLLVGGTPCQSFSVAGARDGMADPRGNLALRFLQLAHATRARWLVWENVPGVLSSNGGRDFGTFLGALVQLGYGWAYRILDAQYFGVPQRRRRVFVVGHSGGDWRRAAAVLFERSCLSGHPAPSRAQGTRAAALTAHGVGTCGADDSQARDRHLIAMAHGQGGAEIAEGGRAPTLSCNHEAPIVAGCLRTNMRNNSDPTQEAQMLVTHTLRGEGHDASEDGTGRGTPLVPEARRAVRRLSPRECERLQGFPDDHTMIPWRGRPAERCPDGPRYRVIGNSMAVPVMRWIGERVARLDQK